MTQELDTHISWPATTTRSKYFSEIVVTLRPASSSSRRKLSKSSFSTHKLDHSCQRIGLTPSRERDRHGILFEDQSATLELYQGRGDRWCFCPSVSVAIRLIHTFDLRLLDGRQHISLRSLLLIRPCGLSSPPTKPNSGGVSPLTHLNPRSSVSLVRGSQHSGSVALAPRPATPYRPPSSPRAAPRRKMEGL